MNVSEKLIKEIIEKITQKVEVDKIMIFGSSVRKDGTKKSDIDLAIFGLKEIEKLPVLKEELNEEIPTLRDIDIVVFEQLTNERLKQRILEEGVIIYERSSTR
ncbi:MAG: nucleotidyltransferase domain-containing protein [Elusimicrobiota bacterium]|nr:nucleotidyltransferase domain-containing protein [Endomicrobiia bacterium]MDW8166552.1 nucleotidyltransferase domain-containing protein [Elusimicrobiota bacterium]